MSDLTERPAIEHTWRFWIDPDSHEWIGVCDSLNLNAIGWPFAECLACAAEAMQLLAADMLAEQREALHHLTDEAQRLDLP